jgi:hypothetical protein
MVARNRTLIKRGPNSRSIEKIVELSEVEVSQNDTITIDSLHASKTMLQAYLIKKTDGTELTTTDALNVITVTGAATNVDCLLLAYGYKP